MSIVRTSSGRHGKGAIFDSSWLQLCSIIIFSILAPAILFYNRMLFLDKFSSPLLNSMAGALLASIIGLIFVRRVTAYPGVRAFGFILPSFAMSYAAVFTAFFAFRIDYGRLYFGTSLVASVLVVYFINFMLDRYVVPRFLVVPFGEVKELVSIDRVEWNIIQSSEEKIPNGLAIVADLRYDFPPEWEHMLAEAAVNGNPVYHCKQLGESLTGRVSISHMSENSLGSLLPNLAYRNVKRGVDIVGAIVLIPLLIVPFLIVGALIMADSPGGAFFLQKRMGFRGREFNMVKFRTMKVRTVADDTEAARRDAMTQSDDIRITRVGRFLRRSRIDELPQVFNVLIGEMSFIGPRPEAVTLSQWYEEQLPFYFYRHIVRPGITGWAQVNQGHVADLDSVLEKLNYDFFYIKNFSSWLDILIVIKTIKTMATGFGSK